MNNLKINHSVRKHAELSASGSERWLNCPGSITLERQVTSHPDYFEPINPFAEEGTLAHELADYCFKYQKDVYELIENSEFEQKCKEKNYDYRDMKHNVQEYLDYVRSYQTSDYKMFNEFRVDFSHVAKNGFGTLDVIIIDNLNKIIHIFDLKYGRGVEVSAYKNSQAILYLLGFFNSVSLFELNKYKKYKLFIHIVQPRINNYSLWELTYDELCDYQDDFTMKAELTLKDNAPLKAGTKQCKWCKATAICPALFKEVTHSFKDISKDSLTNVTLQQKKHLLDNKKLFEDYLNELEKEVITFIQNGGNFEGYKLVQGRSQRKYLEGAEEILENIIGNEVYDKKLKSIGEIEKIMGKKQFNELNITIKPEGKPMLVKDEDKRQALVFEETFINISNKENKND